MSLPDFNPTTPIDLEKLVAILLPNIHGAVRWSCLRRQGRIHEDEVDDLSQQIILKLVEDDFRRLHSFKRRSSFKTWLQAVINRHVHKCLCRRKRAENLDEVDQRALIYSPPQDQDIYAVEKQELLFRALGMLSEQERLLYHLWFVSELDPIKIAAVLGNEVRIIYKRKQTLVLKLARFVQTFQSH
jgi:RNA polymerase sigma factor (sigma-70 family)